MKDKLEVGMYVRYKYENCIFIGKIKFISEVMGFDETLAFAIDNCMEEILKKDIIGEPSHNIIDLIEVGDYVNGYLVLNVLDFNDNTRILSLERIYDNKITEEDIKSIVTKECFENMEYRLGGNNEIK